VVGYETVEGMQERISRYIGPYRFDLEAWRANLDGYISFFQFLVTQVKPRNVIFLAGDVHYGFTISASFTWQETTLPVIQMTSSAQKNTGLALELIGLSSLFSGRTDRHFGWQTLAEDLDAQEAQASRSGRPGGWLPPEVAGRSGRSIYVVKGEKVEMPANYPPQQGPMEKEGREDLGQPDWKDARTFEPTWGYHNEPVVGENNLGLVRFANGGIIIHRLLIPTEEGTRTATALVNELPGKVVLRPLENPGKGQSLP